jgi:peptidyl-prolyl cis-trans isomerase SurA
MSRAFTFAILGVFLATGAATAAAQAPATDSNTGGAAGEGKAVVLDRVIAIINGDVLLQSDVDQELRFGVLEPFQVPAGQDTPRRATRRLINRTLILQQMKEQQQLGITITDAQVQQGIKEMRENLPQCRKYHCTTEEGWKAFLAANDLTEDQVEDRWRQRLAILRFIDIRFRTGIRISQQEIHDYYVKSIVPVYQKENEKPPAQDTIAPRIQELLLQEHVNELLQDWLKSLRDEGSVQILDPAYGRSSGNQSSDEDNH